jgi:predicted RNase H-like HicB family nuclease
MPLDQVNQNAGFRWFGDPMKTFRVPLRVVFYMEDGNWIAHCLEFDLCGDGPTKEEAVRALVESITLQVDESLRHNNPRNLFSPASSEIQEKFFAGKHTAKAELKVQVAIEPVEHLIFEEPEYREYSEDHAVGVAD